MQDAYRLGADDVVLQKTPFSFDVSVWEFFWPLIVGARLVVAAPGAHRDPARLSAAIGEHGVTTLHFVPSMLQAFIEHVALEQKSREQRQDRDQGQDVLASGRPGRASSASSAAARHCRRSFATRWQGCCRRSSWRTCTVRPRPRST
jgi:non-ribosomal peptide synthetase component F